MLRTTTSMWQKGEPQTSPVLFVGSIDDGVMVPWAQWTSCLCLVLTHICIAGPCFSRMARPKCTSCIKVVLLPTWLQHQPHPAPDRVQQQQSGPAGRRYGGLYLTTYNIASCCHSNALVEVAANMPALDAGLGYDAYCLDCPGAGGKSNGCPMSCVYRSSVLLQAAQPTAWTAQPRPQTQLMQAQHPSVLSAVWPCGQELAKCTSG